MEGKECPRIKLSCIRVGKVDITHHFGTIPLWDRPPPDWACIHNPLVTTLEFYPLSRMSHCIRSWIQNSVNIGTEVIFSETYPVYSNTDPHHSGVGTESEHSTTRLVYVSERRFWYIPCVSLSRREYIERNWELLGNSWGDERGTLRPYNTTAKVKSDVDHDAFMMTFTTFKSEKPRILREWACKRHYRSSYSNQLYLPSLRRK